jgi:SAM-dependent methyltransferase
MHLDVHDLRAFYYRTNLGRAAQAVIRGRLVEFWPEAKGQTVVGYGFAAPMLRPYLAEARRVIALMPAPQGVMPWPPGMSNVSVLSEETLWPLETGQVDKLVVLHGLEATERVAALLHECWRVLGPGGRAMFIVPNRTGMWSRRESTPFGFGRPYSMGQLEATLRRESFFPERGAALLYQPPSHRRLWLKSGAFWERLGRSMPMLLAAGVLMVEATKQVQAPTRPGLRAAVRKPLEVLEGIAQPEPKPARRPPAGG